MSLSNLGGKMYNVTYVDGYMEEVATAKRLGKFRRQPYGESLGPREQRSFRYLFVPPASIKPGEYRLVFGIHYQNRDNAKFVDIVFNETAALIPASSKGASSDTLVLGAGVAAGAALLFAIASLMGGKESKGSKKDKPAAKKEKAAPAAQEASEWLQGTAAGNEGRAAGKKAKKRS